MADRQRDSKGRFLPGNTEGRNSPISNGLATEMQLRSAAARKENRTLREVMLTALLEEGGGGFTKMELLVRKAMDNHRKGKLSFRDLKDLAAVLGEEKVHIETDGPQVIVVSAEAVQAAKKWGQ